MVAVLLEEKLIGHSGNVVAHHDVARDTLGLLFVVGRHGAGFAEKKVEKAVQALDGMVAIFGDDRVRQR